MNPNSTTLHKANKGLIDAIVSRDGTLPALVRSDRAHLFGRQLRHAVFLAPSLAAPRNHVEGVFGGRSNSQVRRVYATANIARVKNAVPIGDRSAVQLPCGTVGSWGGAVHPEFTVAVTVDRTRPEPATAVRLGDEISGETLGGGLGFGHASEYGHEEVVFQ